MHHSFDIQLAAKYGIEEAILIHHFQHWINQNYRLKRNFYEGKYWTYQTVKEIAANYPYLNEKKVDRTINNLEKQGVIIKGNFNKTRWDRTNWYTLADQSFLFGTQEDVPDKRAYWEQVAEWENEKSGKCISQKREMEIPKTGNQNPENGEAIPYTINRCIKKNIYPFSSEEMILAKFLYESIKSHLPEFKEPNFNQWAKDIHYLIDIDKRSPEKIKEYILWVNADSWWKGTIQSPSGLRKNWDKITAAMMKKPKKSEPVITPEENQKFAEETARKYLKNPDYKLIFHFEGVKIESSNRAILATTEIFFDSHGFKEIFMNEIRKRDFILRNKNSLNEKEGKKDETT